MGESLCIELGSPYVFCHVDEADYERLSSFKWRLASNGYAATGKGLFMHHVLLCPPDGLVTDHINGNKLDNRRMNLRICTQAQNCMNNGGRSDQLKGVYRVGKRWKAQIRSESLGYFDSKIDAALEYDKAAKAQYGEFARLNFPFGVSPLDRIAELL